MFLRQGYAPRPIRRWSAVLNHDLTERAALPAPGLRDELSREGALWLAGTTRQMAIGLNPLSAREI